MTTIKKLAEQVIRLLEAGTQPVDSKLSQQVISREIRQIIHVRIRGDMRQAYIDGEKTVDSHYVGTYEVDVKTDGQDRCYIDLPQYMYLYSHAGVQQIRPLTGSKKTDRPMIPIMPNEMYLYDRINAGREVLKSQWCYELHRDKAYFTEKDGKTLIEKKIKKVEVQSVGVSVDNIADSDIVPLPPEMEMDVINECLALHGYEAKQAADMVVDGNPDIR